MHNICNHSPCLICLSCCNFLGLVMAILQERYGICMQLEYFSILIDVYLKDFNILMALMIMRRRKRKFQPPGCDQCSQSGTRGHGTRAKKKISLLSLPAAAPVTRQSWSSQGRAGIGKATRSQLHCSYKCQKYLRLSGIIKQP